MVKHNGCHFPKDAWWVREQEARLQTEWELQETIQLVKCPNSWF